MNHEKEEKGKIKVNLKALLEEKDGVIEKIGTTKKNAEKWELGKNCICCTCLKSL
jgi:hypothetical protein